MSKEQCEIKQVSIDEARKALDEFIDLILAYAGTCGSSSRQDYYAGDFKQLKAVFPGHKILPCAEVEKKYGHKFHQRDEIQELGTIIFPRFMDCVSEEQRLKLLTREQRSAIDLFSISFALE